VLQRIELDRSGFACVLGGPDRRTLSMLTAEWAGIDDVDTAIAMRTDQVLVAHARTSVGWP